MGSCAAVLLDAGQTLVHVRTSVGQIYAETAARYGVHVDGEALQRGFERLFRAHQAEFHEGSSEEAERAWWRGLVWSVFAETTGLGALEREFDPFFGDLYDLFATAAPWSVYEDVVPALEVLRAHGLRLAVVSNWDRRLNTLMEGLGLSAHVAFVLTSAEAGVRKPHPRIFALALDRLGTHPEQTIHVGDSYDDDYLGALGAGLRGVLLRRNGTGGLFPARTIRSLLELPGVLGLT